MMSDFQVGKYLGKAKSDFTKQAYVVKYLNSISILFTLP